MCKVLVIDDEEAVRRAVKRRLEREGYATDTAENQAAGIEAIKNQNPPYDVVVTDMVMESSDSGLEVLQEALSTDVFTEVIVLTAYGNVANAVECMKRGAFDYVEKNIPGVDVFELLTMKLTQALERRKVSLATLRKMEQYTRLDPKLTEDGVTAMKDKSIKKEVKKAPQKSAKERKAEKRAKNEKPMTLDNG